MENKYNSDKLPNRSELENQNKPTRGANFSENNQEDEESGGGVGKSKKGSFKQEKLVQLIDKGKFNAKHFWSFLSRQGEDHNSLKQSTLEKLSEEKNEKDLKAEEVKEAEEQVEKIQERQADSEVQQEAGEVSVEEDTLSNEIEAKDALNQAQKEKTTQNQQEVDLQEMARNAIVGKKVSGSIIGAHHGNPLGFMTQASTDTAAVAHSATQERQVNNDNALHGKAAPFGALFANPHGLTVTSVQAGAIGSALTDNVKNQQAKQTQAEKPAQDSDKSFKRK